MKQYTRIGVAGTFAQFHAGHEELLNTAFNLGDKVVIAITSEGMTKNKKLSEKIPGFNDRKANLIHYLTEKGYIDRTEILKLEDKYGTAITDKEQDAIVVSEDTVPAALEINNIRRERGMHPLTIICIPLIYSEDKSPISSTKIREGRIDGNGKLIKKQ